MTWFGILMVLLILGGMGAVGYTFYGKKRGTHPLHRLRKMRGGREVRLLYGTPMRGPRQKMTEKGVDMP